MAEKVDSELEVRADDLEVRMQHLLQGTEKFHLLLSGLRQRIENLEMAFKEFKEQERFVSDVEVQQVVSLRTTATLTEESHSATERQIEPTSEIVEHDCQEISEDTVSDIFSKIKQMAKDLEAKVEAVEVPAYYLQETERKSSHQDDLTQSDEKSDRPSTRNKTSVKSEHHTKEEPRQVKADQEEEGPIEENEVGVEQQTNESGNKLIVSNQEVEQPEETQEIDLVKAEEHTDARNVLDEGLQAKEAVEFEDGERSSENCERKSSECQIPVREITGSNPKGSTYLGKRPKMLMPIQMAYGREGDGHARRQFTGTRKLKYCSSKESRNVTVGEEEHNRHRSESTGLEDSLETILSKELARGALERGKAQEEMMPRESEEPEGTEHDYELEMIEMEWSFYESEFNTAEELDRRFSEEVSKQEEKIQKKIEQSLKLIVNKIENRMHTTLPDDVKISLGEYFRKVVELSLTDMKPIMHSLGSKLRASNDVRCWLHGEIRRLYIELIKRSRREEPFREVIRVLREKLNDRLTILEAANNYCRILLQKYEEVTLNIELEMKKHRTLCNDYRNLKSKYENLKAKCGTSANSEGECEVADQANAGAVRDQREAKGADIDVEQQLSVLAESQKELALKVKSFREIPRLIGNLSAEGVDDFESLDRLRKTMMGALETEPHLQCQLIEKSLTKAKMARDYFWKGVIKELQLTLLDVAGTDSPLLTDLLLEYGFSQHGTDMMGNSPLHLAAKRGNIAVGRALIEAGSHVNKQNSSKATPLHTALYFGHVNFGLLLLRKAANVHLTDSSKVSPLHLAAVTGNFVMVNQLIEHGADVNAVDADGDTPICNAAYEGSEDITKMLVEAGSDIMAVNTSGSTPLHVAAMEGKNAICEYLLDQGAPVDAVNLYGLTPVIMAAMGDETETVQLLISRGARVNCLHKTDSPLHYAALFGNVSTMKYLIRAGANVSAPNEEKKTPLHIAAIEGHTEACSVLLDAGSDVNALEVTNRTALHMVAMNGGSIPTAEVLVNNGADMTALDNDGLTPCELGHSFNNVEFCRWLEQKMQTNTPQRRKGSKKKKRSRAKK